MTEQEEIWDRLKHIGDTVTIVCHGNGTAQRFNSGWLTGSKIVNVSVDGVIQSLRKDYIIVLNDVVFKEAPGTNQTVAIEVYS